MTDPTLKPFFPVLNALAEMQASKVYAVRSPDLARAEATIVHLATDLERTKSKLDDALIKLSKIKEISQ